MTLVFHKLNFASNLDDIILSMLPILQSNRSSCMRGLIIQYYPIIQ